MNNATMINVLFSSKISLLIAFSSTLLYSTFGMNPALLASDNLDRDAIMKGLIPITGVSELKRPSVDLNIEFELNSWRLTVRAMRQLDVLAEALTTPPLSNSRFAINGHTDASGDAGQNRRLSFQRADSVADYLVVKKNIVRDRLEINGFGEDKLKNTLNPNSAENRRVEIVNLTPFEIPQKTNSKTGYEAIN